MTSYVERSQLLRDQINLTGSIVRRWGSCLSRPDRPVWQESKGDRERERERERERDGERKREREVEMQMEMEWSERRWN